MAANSISSSVLPMLQSHVDAAAGSQTIGTEVVAVIRLDDVTAGYLRGAKAVLLKVDTQGFEWDVLDGAVETLGKVAAVQLELSLLPLYGGQRLWRDYVDEDGRPRIPALLRVPGLYRRAHRTDHAVGCHVRANVAASWSHT